MEVDSSEGGGVENWLRLVGFPRTCCPVWNLKYTKLTVVRRGTVAGDTADCGGKERCV